jgi:PIN domain nuclease of toxin-antitoxin system
MRFLLDTHVLIWASDGSPRLSAAAGALIADPSNDLFFSAANMWEIGIKRRLQRPDFTVDPHGLRLGLLANGYVELSITSEHAIFAANLPQIHKDPFDRLLVSQATVEGIMLLTADRIVTEYPGPIQRV